MIPPLETIQGPNQSGPAVGTVDSPKDGLARLLRLMPKTMGSCCVVFECRGIARSFLP